MMAVTHKRDQWYLHGNQCKARKGRLKINRNEHLRVAPSMTKRKETASNNEIWRKVNLHGVEEADRCWEISNINVLFVQTNTWFSIWKLHFQLLKLALIWIFIDDVIHVSSMVMFLFSKFTTCIWEKNVYQMSWLSY